MVLRFLDITIEEEMYWTSSWETNYVKIRNMATARLRYFYRGFLVDLHLND